MKKLDVEIIIPAYNEAKTIRGLIKALLKQEQTNYNLKKITVYSDGSSDRTVELVRQCNNPIVHVFNGRRQRGKSIRLNHAYRKFKYDVLIVFDADVLPAHSQVVSQLVKPFTQVENLGLVGGNAQPIPATTLVESAVNSMFYSRLRYKSIKHGGHNVHGLWGCCLAMSRKFANTLQLPSDVPDDAFTYFANLSQGFEFRHAYQAKVWFQSPQTIKDQIRQGIRFSKSSASLSKYFDPELIASEYEVPLKSKTLSALGQIVTHPIGYLLMKYMHFQVVRAGMSEYKPYWEQVSSTKSVITS